MPAKCRRLSPRGAQRANGYDQRTNVESTFSMVKAKFGDSVRSKTETAMGNEVMAKVVCHNICCLISAMYELGIAPEFQAVAV